MLTIGRCLVTVWASVQLWDSWSFSYCSWKHRWATVISASMILSSSLSSVCFALLCVLSLWYYLANIFPVVRVQLLMLALISCYICIASVMKMLQRYYGGNAAWTERALIGWIAVASRLAAGEFVSVWSKSDLPCFCDDWNCRNWRTRWMHCVPHTATAKTPLESAVLEDDIALNVPSCMLTVLIDLCIYSIWQTFKTWVIYYWIFTK